MKTPTEAKPGALSQIELRHVEGHLVDSSTDIAEINRTRSDAMAVCKREGWVKENPSNAEASMTIRVAARAVPEYLIFRTAIEYRQPRQAARKCFHMCDLVGWTYTMLLSA
jgi:hypothetical protein